MQTENKKPALRTTASGEVRKYTHYRTYLAAYVQERKRIDPRWSFGGWSRKLGLKTTSSISKIIEGERDPGPQLTEQLVTYFKFNDKDSTYFRDLVRLHKLRRDPRMSVLLMGKMEKEHPHGAIKVLDDETFKILSNWYYLPLRELTGMPRFQEDPQTIAQRFAFKVTPREIRQAIDTMIKTGLLKRDSQGKLQMGEFRVQTQNDVASEAVKRFHEQGLEHARIALREMPVTDREVQASCFVMSESKLSEAKELIREFRARFVRLLEEESGDRLYQIQIQFYPLLKKEKSDEIRN